MKTQRHAIRHGVVSTLALAVIAASGAACAASPTTAAAAADGVYRFTFGVNATQDGSFAVPAGAVYDAQGAYDAAATFTYGFLGTTESSFRDDVPASPSCAEPSAIDGFQVIEGQRIVLHDATDLNGVTCVTGPAASEYLPSGASRHEGRYPIRFAMRGEERAYYAVTCTVANASSTANADVTRDAVLLAPELLRRRFGPLALRPREPVDTQPGRGRTRHEREDAPPVVPPQAGRLPLRRVRAQRI